MGAEADWVACSKVLKKGADFISIANFSADATSNPDSVFKNFLLKSNDKDLVGWCRLKPGVYGYRVRCIRI